MSARTVSPAIGSLLLAVALLGAGCGGDAGADGSSEAGETRSALTMTQVIQQADAICAKTEGRQERLIGKFSEHGLKRSEKTEEELIRFAGLPPLRSQARELRELAAEAGQPRFDALIDSLEAAVELAEEQPTLLITPGKDPFEVAEAEAVRLGFMVCGGT